jgi:hypothetical protein
VPLKDESYYEDLLEANNAITETILIKASDVEFTMSDQPGTTIEIYTDSDGKKYIVDTWFNPIDDQRDLDNHALLFMRDGFNAPDIDIWSLGANGQFERIKPSEDLDPANADKRKSRQLTGDDVHNAGE